MSGILLGEVDALQKFAGDFIPNGAAHKVFVYLLGGPTPTELDAFLAYNGYSVGDTLFNEEHQRALASQPQALYPLLRSATTAPDIVQYPSFIERVALSSVAMDVATVSEAFRNALASTEESLAIILASDMALGKFIAGGLGLNPGDFDSAVTFLADQANMDALLADDELLAVVGPYVGMVALEEGYVLGNADTLEAMLTDPDSVSQILASYAASQTMIKDDFARGVLSGLSEDILDNLWAGNPKFLVRNDLSKYTRDYTENAWAQSVYGIFISDDGKYFYDTYSGLAYYELTTPFDLRTKVQMGGNFSGSTNISTSAPIGIWFRPGGYECFIGNYGGSDISCVSLAEPWKLESATGTQVLATGYREMVHLSLDGTLMFQSSRTATIYVWDLTTPWDITTASNQRAVSLPAGTVYEFVFDWLGRTLYTADRSGNVRQFNLTAPWDLTTAVLKNTLGGMVGPYGLSISRDGGVLYESDDSGLVAAYSYQP